MTALSMVWKAATVILFMFCLAPLAAASVSNANAVEQFVAAYRGAWQAKDVDSILSFYAPDAKLRFFGDAGEYTWDLAMFADQLSRRTRDPKSHTYEMAAFEILTTDEGYVAVVTTTLIETVSLEGEAVLAFEIQEKLSLRHSRDRVVIVERDATIQTRD